MKKKNILVSGSIVYDTIFSLRGKIKEQVVLEDGRLGNQSLMFTAKEKKVFFGGTAGNILYGLGSLGVSPFGVGIVGKDFNEYEKRLKVLHTKPRFKKDLEGYCSSFYAMTDQNGEQIGVFQPGACDTHLNSFSLLETLSKKEIEDMDIAIFSPGTAKSIVNQITEFRNINKKAFVIFDPGQMLSIDFTKDLVLKALRKSTMGIFNETECNILHNKFGLDLNTIFSLGVKFVIETKGKDGSVLYEFENNTLKQTPIKGLPVKKVIDPTGAGDAYRSGLIYGIASNKSIKEAMQIGSKLGAACVKAKGGQTY